MLLKKTLLHFISVVAEHSEKNKMTISNLALIFAPVLLRTQLQTMEAIFQVGLVNSTVMSLVKYCEKIFKDFEVNKLKVDEFRVTYRKAHVDDVTIVDERVSENGKQEV